MIKRLEKLVQSPLGRLLAGTAGLACLAFLVHRAGPASVWAAIVRSPGLFPVAILLEGGLTGSELVALYVLYGRDRRKIPVRELIRSGLISYAIMCVMPMGRAIAEATRAAMLSRFVGGAKAAAIAARCQGVSLLGGASISAVCAMGVFSLLGRHWLAAAMAGNVVLLIALGGGILFVGRRSRIGAWFQKRGKSWGSDLDAHLKGEEAVPVAAVAWALVGRGFQTVQRMVLLVAVGGTFGLGLGLCSEALQLVSGTLGDIVPSNVGVTEAVYTVSAQVLRIGASDGIAIALLAHLAQLFWLGVGSIVPLVWPPTRLVPAEESR